ncbi:hypothetical protein A1D31_38775 [Bradyrhizobium liaoningense]|nr:hypothetical protein A1D31_38775 [Bradyrhizobium liaoningense]
MFCGKPFSGQAHNFEHVIPRWLVREADLSKRTAPIDFPSRQFSAAMSRIGGRACETCNEASSDLEGRARVAYANIRDGNELSSSDGRSLLDWLDKLRVGLWLWALDVGKDDYGIIPKFRINERMAHKDRMLVASKYRAGPPMKGLDIWGASEYFVWSPSAIGFFINNIVLLSVSSDFLVARHLRKLAIRCFLHDSGDLEIDPELSDDPGNRLEFFGAPFILGQVILPTDLFGKLNLKMASESPLHPGWGEGPILKLNGNLVESGRMLGSVPLFTGNHQAHLVLMELYFEKATKYLLDNFLASDFTRMSSVEKQEEIRAQAQEYLDRGDVDIGRLLTRYEYLTGLQLKS